jgi:hypothetical protein
VVIFDLYEDLYASTIFWRGEPYLLGQKPPTLIPKKQTTKSESKLHTSVNITASFCNILVVQSLGKNYLFCAKNAKQDARKRSLGSTVPGVLITNSPCHHSLEESSGSKNGHQRLSQSQYMRLFITVFTITNSTLKFGLYIYHFVCPPLASTTA